MTLADTVDAKSPVHAVLRARFPRTIGTCIVRFALADVVLAFAVAVAVLRTFDCN